MARQPRELGFLTGPTARPVSRPDWQRLIDGRELANRHGRICLARKVAKRVRLGLLCFGRRRAGLVLVVHRFLSGLLLGLTLQAGLSIFNGQPGRRLAEGQEVLWYQPPVVVWSCCIASVNPLCW